MDDLLQLLSEIQFPYAYDHFIEGESPDPPFICYLLPKSDNFSADGLAYHKLSEVAIELYTGKKDLATEQAIENALDNHKIFYNKVEIWISSEKLYEVVYSFEINI